ncbi:RasGEF domain-containing protein [Pyrenophora tritici-repentis]|uniref:RasGEF domain containing protein n=1 Tax=Pyrenophora tritici-repentis TaxID=45151 RepID=A0A834SAH1_9PLEO|nr:RasGEF domain containing protein [Pyrenophora tritici-repentis]KAI0588774.1 RasGEF domain-containing protein [Pyrenophora tritici-repentis]KAI0627323.1 RasGEF domain-containing protein [Pyrenophora tritici-repentis]
MALPAQQQNGFAAPGSPAESKRDFLPRSAGADTARRRADDSRRLRRVKDSKEQLKRRTTRARGASYSTIDTTASNTSAGRSYTVANVNNGVIYLRPVVRPGNLRGLPQPDPFVLPPQTPPDSATLDSVRPVSDEWEQSLYGSRTPRSEPTPPLPDRGARQSFLSSRPLSEAYSPVPHRFRATMDRPPIALSGPSSARVSQAPIGPRLYDALTANPDDRAVVRFNVHGDMIAATPARLVAHITSPSFLDYELLSDFFLTFRAFLCTRDLIAYLISRLRWAVERQDDFGRIVRVRTFVALRHWILNYFVDDFMPCYALRCNFCHLVNSLYTDLQAREDGGGGDLKIVGELKKCWRRTCALYWDTEDSFAQNCTDTELLPGGEETQPGPVEEPVPILLRPTTPPRSTVRDTKETMGSNPSDHFASRHMDWAQRARHTPQNSMSSPYVPSQEYENETGHQQPSSPKRNHRPTHSHSYTRSGSFSDALRDSRAPLSIHKSTLADYAMSAVANMPGTLVRGGLIHPGSPYFEVKTLRPVRSQHLQEPDDADVSDSQRPGYGSSPGMKKIFGSVRRALSTRQQSSGSPQLGGIAPQRQPPGMRASNPGAVSTVSVSGGIQKRRIARPKPQVRIDVLAATVAESFRAAVQEQLDYESRENDGVEPPDLGGFEFEFDENGAPTTKDAQRQNPNPDPRVHSTITSGSKSIVIIDDTGAPPPPPLPIVATLSTDLGKLAAHPQSHRRGMSIDECLMGENANPVQHSDLYDDPEPQQRQQSEEQDTSQFSIRRPMLRRSMSAGPEGMHSFRHRGSSKASFARGGSLRRHASYNSVLSRHQGSASIATFQTMSSDNDPFFLDRQPITEASGPARQLRRRPGGDLRAADNIHDLEILQRPHSTGSVSNRTHSVSNSVILRSDRYIDPDTEALRGVEGPPEAEIPKKPISLVATHSSQPNLRPSFEAEVAKLAALPDDTDDEGGVESALMKLEGRYEKKSPNTDSRRTTVDMDEPLPTTIIEQIFRPGTAEQDEHYDNDEGFHHQLASSETDGDGMYRLPDENGNRRVPAVTSVGESTDSYSSIPLLDRGLSDLVTPQRARTLETMRSSAKPSPLQFASQFPSISPQSDMPPGTSSSMNSSIEYVVETESMKRIPTGGTLPMTSYARESFLVDEDEDVSDAASTPGARSGYSSHGVRSFFDDEVATPGVDADNHPTHPMRHPPTPPLTANRLNDTMPDATDFDRGPPTPGLTPTVSRGQTQTPNHATGIPFDPPKTRPTPQLPTKHLPFVLAYDSETLAQQFTIVEKDALDEIDWKELIELRWKQSSPQIRDWVQYLRTEEARGVDVVIARFNLVVKWVVSECLLTEDIHERARCIVKYIHIATHARRYRNYATMYQIAIALISNDISSLKKTWALVPAAEILVMQELEGLVQPLKNFHNLRLEMETATVEDGCIPFIGVYTRDLIYNAQKPAFIDAPVVDGERLVNFDRHHTAASIVKNLLRLLEASSKYTFKVEPHIISKCLWLAALSDEEITQRSRQCE